jgi:hypothetical protein
VRKIALFSVLLILFSLDVFADDVRIRGGGAFTIMRAGDAHANLGGFYFSVEHVWRKNYGFSFNIRKEEKTMGGPDNGLYFSFAGVYRWQPKFMNKFRQGSKLMFRSGYEFGLAHVDYNAYTEEGSLNRWTFISQNGNLFVRYPFLETSTKIPLPKKINKGFFKTKDFNIEVGARFNFPTFGEKEAVRLRCADGFDRCPDSYAETKNSRIIKIVPILYIGVNFRY